jgi:hypothetical protein
LSDRPIHDRGHQDGSSDNRTQHATYRFRRHPDIPLLASDLGGSQQTELLFKPAILRRILACRPGLTSQGPRRRTGHRGSRATQFLILDAVTSAPR